MKVQELFAAEIRALTARLRMARISGAWDLEQHLWADLAEAIDRLEANE